MPAILRRVKRSALMRLRFFLAAASLTFALSSYSIAQDSRGLGLFHDYVEPLLKKNCYECHSHESKKAKGGLVLDSRDAILTGGDLGPALTPGDPENSLLLEAVMYHNGDLQMPPEGKLADSDIEHLREWIQLGAPDPRKGPPVAKRAPQRGPNADELWSVQPLKAAALPREENEEWSPARVDRFVLASLEKSDYSRPARRVSCPWKVRTAEGSFSPSLPRRGSHPAPRGREASPRGCQGDCATACARSRPRYGGRRRALRAPHCGRCR